MISNGVIISGGLVRNLVLSPGARVDSWFRVTRAVILHNSRVSHHAIVQDAILDKNVVAAEGATVPMAARSSFPARLRGRRRGDDGAGR